VNQPGLRPHKATHETGGSDQLTDLTLSKLTMTGDITLGAHKLKTTNLLLSERTSENLQVKDSSGTDYRDFTVRSLEFGEKIYCYSSSGIILTYASASRSIQFQSHNGSAHVTNVKLIGGNVEISSYKLFQPATFNTAWSTVDVASGSPYTLPAGVYYLEQLPLYAQVEVYDSTASDWRVIMEGTAGGGQGGLIISDGTNVRFASTSGTQTFNYVKLW